MAFANCLSPIAHCLLHIAYCHIFGIYTSILVYSILKIFVGFALKFFCKKIIVNRPASLKEKGPLLLAVNHPNSFLDAVILDVLFEHPLYSLARGDAFVNKLVIRIFTAFKILPVYRLSEGANNLQSNYDTFDQCKDLFRKNGIVLIFSEGKCINEWHLRPLKKGTARLAISSWEENIPLRVLPVGINYSSFRRFGKTIHINLGNVISKDDFDSNSSEGSRIMTFNQQLKESLQNLVYEIAPHDKERQKTVFVEKPSVILNSLLFIPALIGWLTHQPLYYPIKKFTLKKTDHNDHFDSVLMALLFITYPFYLLIISFTISRFDNNWYGWLSACAILPFTAWAWVKYKSAV